MLRLLQLPDNFSGKLWLTSMPGRYEPLEDFLGWCRGVSVDEIVCLVDSDEIGKKSSEYAAELEAGTFPLPVEQFPIPDYGVPKDIKDLVDLARRVVEKLQTGRKIVLHCAAGHGRTGMFAVIVLVAAGNSIESALDAVRKAGSEPDTATQNALIKKAAIRLADRKRIKRKKLVFLTGAGISAESGIGTFRASDGLWNGYRIQDVASPMGWGKSREKVLEFYNQRRAEVIAASPNAGHLACAELEKDFEVTVVTQNIDDLHERAGSTRVFHLHGEILKGQSSKNPNLVFPLDGPAIRIGDKSPDGSQVRPHVVWFEESVLRMKEATKAAREADVFVVCGTSLVVSPAAGLAQLPRPSAPLYLIDPTPPTLPDGNWTVIAEPASSGMQRLMRLLRGG